MSKNTIRKVSPFVFGLGIGLEFCKIIFQLGEASGVKYEIEKRKPKKICRHGIFKDEVCIKCS